MELKLSADQTMHEIAKFHFILAEGRKGNHLLFTPEMIRHAFTKSPEELFQVFEANLEFINKALNHTFLLTSFEEKSGYIRSLPMDVQDALVYGYFQLLDESTASSKERHIN